MTHRPLIDRLAVTFARAGLARPAPTRRLTKLRRMVIQEGPLAGFEAHCGEMLWPELSVGAGLQLARESKNPNDARAVALRFRGKKLGYLPGAHTAAVAQLLDRGHALEARIVALRQSLDPAKRVTVAVIAQAA